VEIPRQGWRRIGRAAILIPVSTSLPARLPLALTCSGLAMVAAVQFFYYPLDVAMNILALWSWEGHGYWAPPWRSAGSAWLSGVAAGGRRYCSR
jgi:hypothetical protein